jgi:hypothetical protein
MREATFGPEETARMGNAYEATLKKLGLKRTDLAGLGLASSCLSGRPRPVRLRFRDIPR